MLTKKQQLYKNKEPKISSIEREYLNWLQEQNHNCFVCGISNNIEMHHVKLKSTDKKIHKNLIPLCIEHHKGKSLSPHGSPNLFRSTFSMEQQLKVAKELYNTFLEQR
ncbi:MAG: hypothetical protein ACRCXT_17175 [Paraclostridium sp.]